MADCGCPQWRAREVYVIYLLRARVREEPALGQTDGAPEIKKWKELEMRHPSVPSCFSRVGGEVGWARQERRPGLGRSTHVRPKRQGQLRGQGQGERFAAVLWVGQAQILRCWH